MSIARALALKIGSLSGHLLAGDQSLNHVIENISMIETLTDLIG